MAAVFSSDNRQLDLRSSSSPALISLRLRESLEACSSSIASEECIQSDQAVAPVTSLLHSLVEPPTSDLEETMPGIECSEIALDEIYRYVSSPDSNRVVVEALSLELPKLVTKFAPLSAKCWVIGGKIIEYFASVCNPREMLSVLCEALSSRSDDSEAPGCYSHILLGLSKGQDSRSTFPPSRSTESRNGTVLLPRFTQRPHLARRTSPAAHEAPSRPVAETAPRRATLFPAARSWLGILPPSAAILPHAARSGADQSSQPYIWAVAVKVKGRR